MMIILEAGRSPMAQDKLWRERPASPKIHKIRKAFREQAAPETAAECVEAADRVIALLATLPPAEAERYATYLNEAIEIIRDRLPPMQ